MNELFENIPFSEYLKWDYMSQSTIKRIDESIPAFLEEFKPNSSMPLGTAFHNKILTPHLNEYVIEPTGNKRTNAFKDLLAHFEKANAGKAIITEDQAVSLEKMVKSFNSHKTANDLLCLADNIEVSAFVEVEGMRFKCRADWLMEMGVGDLKSTKSADPRWFWKSVKDYGYDVQAWLYCQAFERDNFYIVATENNGHFITQVFEVSPKTMARGREKLLRCIDKYNKWKATEDRPKTYNGTWDFITV